MRKKILYYFLYVDIIGMCTVAVLLEIWEAEGCENRGKPHNNKHHPSILFVWVGLDENISTIKMCCFYTHYIPVYAHIEKL